MHVCMNVWIYVCVTVCDCVWVSESVSVCVCVLQASSYFEQASMLALETRNAKAAAMAKCKVYTRTDARKRRTNVCKETYWRSDALK
jgi:hypothetical protein